MGAFPPPQGAFLVPVVPGRASPLAGARGPACGRVRLSLGSKLVDQGRNSSVLSAPGSWEAARTVSVKSRRAVLREACVGEISDFMRPLSDFLGSELPDLHGRAKLHSLNSSVTTEPTPAGAWWGSTEFDFFGAPSGFHPGGLPGRGYLPSGGQPAGPLCPRAWLPGPDVQSVYCNQFGHQGHYILR